VRVSASVVYTDGRLRRFSVAAHDVSGGSIGKLLGTGEITRVVVDADRFLARL